MRRLLLLSEAYRLLRPRMLPTPAREKRPDPLLTEGAEFSSPHAGLPAPSAETLTAWTGMWWCDTSVSSSPEMEKQASIFIYFCRRDPHAVGLSLLVHRVHDGSPLTP